ncbi:hypothetical protein F8O01_09130 [Pseudoclavibacter chungangensis]|uniref:Uncharacterized protein n=1 Tax=Pseudoclavibacter chungangensis TaxID=587635 RepID=A0A7J5BR84_9MICO|nr:hypothetical protein [Pseudoclavibacter chungangensis]KAB1656812.1 hypothetical protein F8O01_09130 [Pseudoclavibacter chungangensis]NYJ67262.1 hypothetical protein [Pseudoclavibacter chungangensis]
MRTLNTTSRPVRGAALVAAIGLSALLGGCAGSGGDTSGTTSSATSSADTVSECAQVQASIESISTTAEGIQSKIPGDIPGAVADLQSIQTELTTLGDDVQDSELKGHIEDAKASVTALLDLFTKVSNGEISQSDAITQGLAEYSTLKTAIDEVNAYCA